MNEIIISEKEFYLKILGDKKLFDFSISLSKELKVVDWWANDNEAQFMFTCLSSSYTILVNECLIRLYKDGKLVLTIGATYNDYLLFYMAKQGTLGSWIIKNFGESLRELALIVAFYLYYIKEETHLKRIEKSVDCIELLIDEDLNVTHVVVRE